MVPGLRSAPYYSNTVIAAYSPPDPPTPPGPPTGPSPGGSSSGTSGSGGSGTGTPSLNTEEHFSYLVGYEDGTIRPGTNITRAEAVTIFFRLLTDDVRNEYWSTTNSYPDVEQSAWYNNAISTMSNLGVVNGSPDGLFRPRDNITRVELAKIAVSFFHDADLHLTGNKTFDDVPQDKWYWKYVEAAAELGLIEGYPGNIYCPDKAITRAETVSIVNRALGRKPHRDGLLKDMVTWPDNMDMDAW